MSSEFPLESDLAANADAIDTVDVDAVKKERLSLTRGPMAVTLLFVAGAIALIGLGGFWAYPAWQHVQEQRTETDNLIEKLQEKRQELVRVKAENEKRGPSEAEQAYAAKIAPEFDPGQSIRDLVRLVSLDPTTPDDDLRLRSFSFDPGKPAGGVLPIGTTLNLTGTTASMLRLLETASDPAAGHRLATPRSMSLTFASLDTIDANASPAEARFSYLLRQKQRHLLNADEEHELEIASAARVAKYQEAKRQRDLALQRQRQLEGERATEGSALLAHADALAKAEQDVKTLSETVSDLEKSLRVLSEEVTANMKIDIYAEADAKAAAAGATTAGAAATGATAS